MSEIHTTLLKGRIVLEGDSQGARIVGQRIMSGPVCVTITPIEDDGDATLEVWAQTWSSHNEAVVAERARAGRMVGEWAARLEGRRSWGTAPSWPEVFEELEALRRQIEGGGEG